MAETRQDVPAPARTTAVKKVLAWLRAGYPEGIPGHDYVALLGVLQRHLTATEMDHIAGELVHDRAPDDPPITADQVRDAISRRVHETPAADDIARVSARLAAGGWPLAPVARA